MNEPDLIEMSQLKYTLLRADIEFQRDKNASEKQGSNEKISPDSSEPKLDDTETSDIRLIYLDVSPCRETER